MVRFLNKALTIFIGTVFLCITAYAQKSDTLKDVHVTTHAPATDLVKSKWFLPGVKITTIDTNTLQRYASRSVADLLSHQLPVFVKSYSFNGLATVYFRGASAAQSQVIWNGVPITNVASGVSDISGLPVFFVSKVSVAYGSGAAMYGSGNIGGALLLQNEEPAFDTFKIGLSATAAMGSYGQSVIALEAKASDSNRYLSVKYLHQQANNDFYYKNDKGEDVRTANARTSSNAVMMHAARNMHKYGVLEAIVWAQIADRQIPKALFESESVKKQNDASFRSVLYWHKSAGKYNWYARSSFISDQLKYTDSLLELKSNNIALQYYQELGCQANWGKWGKATLFMPIQVGWVDADYLHTNKDQARVGLAAMYAWSNSNNRLQLAANGRMEWVSGLLYGLPGANAVYNLLPQLQLRVNSQYTYRIPNLNELYYYPGGNDKLKPEQGWGHDAGYRLAIQHGNVGVMHDVAVYERTIDNWIVWLGGAIYTPHNVAQVRSRGIETDNRLDVKVRSVNSYISVSTAYVLSTTSQSYIPNDGSVGKQLPNAPRYNARLNIGGEWRGLTVNYNHTYTGYRFTNFDESAWLMPYQTGNVQVGYAFKPIKRYMLQMNMQCNNVWSETYYLLLGRPMPKANFMLAIKASVL